MSYVRRPAKCCICGNKTPYEYMLDDKLSYIKCDICNVMTLPGKTYDEAVDIWNSVNLMRDILEDIDAAADDHIDILNF